MLHLTKLQLRLKLLSKVLKTFFNIQLVSGEGEQNKEKNNDTRRIISKKVGRNEPCPCGSGKKYKQCHGN